MDRRRFLSHVSMLSVAATVVPTRAFASLGIPDSLRALPLASIPQLKIVPDPEMPPLRLYVGLDLVRGLLCTEPHGTWLFLPISDYRKALDDVGFQLPKVRIMDKLSLPNDCYSIEVYGVEVKRGVASSEYLEDRSQAAGVMYRQYRELGRDVAAVAVRYQHIWDSIPA